ncbi:MAG TPA: hypothetical protein VN428_12475 [Bryobacteraceae bacterium]|nr:hypothetical protein [Bryobacteraceae bacterium]
MRLPPAYALLIALVVGCSASPLEVPSEALVVTARLEAESLSVAAGDSLRVTISVANPRERPVTVRLGGPPYKTGQIPAAETEGAGFGARVIALDPDRGGPSSWTWGQPAIVLGARATLSHTFVFAAKPSGASGSVLPDPGTYRVIASFGHREAAPLVVRVQE